jgi:amidophosphoribosyltransferase
LVDDDSCEPASPRHACGVFGVAAGADAVRRSYYGLFALQHRGQESAGIAALADGGAIARQVGLGLVAEVLAGPVLGGGFQSQSRFAIGHVRYSTTGAPTLENAQPLTVKSGRGPIALAHNGNLVNSRVLRDGLEAAGSIFQGTSDSEVVLHLYAQPGPALEEHLLQVLRRLEGAYSFLFLVPGAVLAARDPRGWRPLWLGRVPGGGHAFASETAAFHLTGIEPVREVTPGELVIASESGLRSLRIDEPRPAHCLFEHIYFARPDSVVFGDSVYAVRKALGRRLADEHPAAADIVVPIPDSGTPAAIGYAERSGLPFELGLVRSHYVGRTFIHPTSQGRREGVNLKLAAVRSIIEGKRLVVIDDSIVRGTTARSRVRLLRDSGAREVHLRISCPPIRHPCFFGVDFPSADELIANQHQGDPERMAGELGADSLGFLSEEGLLASVSSGRASYCAACFNGVYPDGKPLDVTKDALALARSPAVPQAR